MPLPFILSIPHSSRRIPGVLRPRLALSDQQIIESVDFGAQEIFGQLPAKDVIIAQWSRLLVDLNRSPENRGDKGVAALTDYQGRTIYKPGQAPTASQIDRFITDYYRPYHEKITMALGRYNTIGLIDGHSLNGIGPADAPDAGQQRKDVVLSNNGDNAGKPVHGQGPVTCPTEIMAAMVSALEAQGFTVSVNSPYKGGHIVKHYSANLPVNNCWAMQMELNQNLYMPLNSTRPDQERIIRTTARIQTALTRLANNLLRA